MFSKSLNFLTSKLRCNVTVPRCPDLSNMIWKKNIWIAINWRSNLIYQSRDIIQEKTTKEKYLFLCIVKLAPC